MNKLEDVDSAQEELSRCIVELLLAEPFFGHLLGGVVRVIDPATRSAGVRYNGGRYYLHLNDHWFRRTLRTRSERVAVIKHEALHLLLQHVLRFDPHLHDRFRYGIAADLVVNPLIGPWKLPPDGMNLAMFPGLSADGSLEEYYQQLGQVELHEDFVLGAHHSDHARWGLEDPTDRAVAQVELARLTRQAVDRSGGRVPEHLKGTVERLLEIQQPATDWRRQLRIFTSSSVQTRLADTLRRPSRRYQTFPGLKVRRRQRLVVAVDTSASISDLSLGHFFAEIQGIYRAGAEVQVVEFDHQVQRTYAWTGRPPLAAHGRGGTRYDPLLTWLQERSRQPDGCIFLTDGHAPPPQVRPPCSLLWVIPANGSAENLRFGRVIRMRN